MLLLRDSRPAPAQTIRTTSPAITGKDRWDHFLARWGVNRMGRIVPPGLYRLGNPDMDSPVFASANYTLSFDALRSALAGTDAWILVLDTKGHQCLVRCRERHIRHRGTDPAHCGDRAF